jgi:hypothetical protein
MDLVKKFQFFKDDLDTHVRRITRKRNRDKRKAFSLKIISVAFAAAITVLLGLKTDEKQAEYFRNIALVLGAAITYLSAVDAFYDHRTLWVRRTVTVSRLKNLKRAFEFYIEGREEDEISEVELSIFMEQLNDILQDDLKDWLRLREDVSSSSETPKLMNKIPQLIGKE